MSPEDINQKLALHRAFWSREPLKRPLVSFQLEDYFVSRRYKAAEHLLTDGKKITPDMLVVESFLGDFERMYQETCRTGQDGFWVAEPFCGIPWMEAIFGCEIYGTKSSFVSHPCIESIRDLKKIRFDPENPWFGKYMEFVDKLNRLSAGRFPIGQPIMRGASDVVGALLGQMELVYAFADAPEVIREAFFKIMNALRTVIKTQWAATTGFHGGYSMGFYHVWCPDKCIWFQEDLSALLSPQIYKAFLREPDASVCKGYDYTAVHLHPASFFILDTYMQMEDLKAIQINKDVGGPSVKNMMPYFQKVLAGKNLIIYGDLDEEDIDRIWEGLPRKGTFLNITADTVERARELMEHVESRC